MLHFSGEQITFSYVPNSHLKASYTLSNHNKQPVLFKLKITRPKYYLVKPVRSSLNPGQSLTLEITMHKEGVSECYGDKFKCFYKITNRLDEDSTQDIERQNGVEIKRIPIRVLNLPQQYQKFDSGRTNSELKTLNMGESRNMRETTFEGMIAQRQERVVNLRNSINQIKKTQSINQHHQAEKGNWKGLFIIFIGGLLLGAVSSVWL